MANRFTVRVQLHADDAPPGTYTKLHEAMRAAGFTRTISWDSETVTYQMPWGEYNYTKEATTDEVLELAKGAALSVWTELEILVTPAGGPRGKYNLQTAA